MRYRLNTPTVISEIIDGEVIVIHLGTGKYYSILAVLLTFGKPYRLDIR